MTGPAELRLLGIPMLEHYIYSILSKLLGIGLAIGCIYFLRRSLKQEWPEADAAAWKDKDDDW